MFYYPSGKETFAQIAAKHKINEAALKRFNPRSQQNIPPPHHRLRIPKSNQDVPESGPYYYYIQAGDTFSNLAQHFHLAVVSLLQANPDTKPEKLRIGQPVVIPVTHRNQNNYLWPVTEPQIKISFSWQRWGLHQGLALATKNRQEIFPIAAGEVVFAGEVRGFGKVVIMKHSTTQQSIYAYCHALFVEQNTYLSGLHPVCSAGKQRQIDKPGIYFELREAGLAVPPENYLPALPWPP
ncbi:MAG: peptidoglycan DD-metalloendopeptidase family protein [Pseudomonadaceae bacterium]|nr:peptidoglycan DD-metalloendopeptidase family protein [Pseudomonadaceae bacterium]